MDCAEEGLPAIGYVVPARVIGQVLANAAGGLADVDSYCPANVVSTEAAADDVRVVIEAQGVTETVSARLVVAADGADSVLRERAGIDSLQTDYGQTAIVTNITPQLPHHNIAYERFTDSWPACRACRCRKGVAPWCGRWRARRPMPSWHWTMPHSWASCRNASGNGWAG